VTSKAAAGRRDEVLAVLRASAEPRSIAQIADQVQIHPNTVRFHLEALRRSGQVAQQLGRRVGPGRPPLLFRATHRMDPAGPTNYRLLAAVLATYLAENSTTPAATATELGRDWGPRLVDSANALRPRSAPARRGAALTRMVTTLVRLGFAPDSPSGARDTTIRLRHCPFLGLVRPESGVVDGARPAHGEDDATRHGYQTVICALHLGLMQGVFGAIRSPVTVDRLEPFVEPDLCVAHLR
jgi:predicted ArsR family transcriptional regulator